MIHQRTLESVVVADGVWIGVKWLMCETTSPAIYFMMYLVSTAAFTAAAIYNLPKESLKVTWSKSVIQQVQERFANSIQSVHTQ